MALAWNQYEFKIADHFLSALINDDRSGMDDDEDEQLDDFVDAAYNTAVAAGWRVGHWSCVSEDGDEDYGECDVTGLFARRASVQLMVYREVTEEIES